MVQLAKPSFDTLITEGLQIEPSGPKCPQFIPLLLVLIPAHLHTIAHKLLRIYLHVVLITDFLHRGLVGALVAQGQELVASHVRQSIL